MDAEVNLMRWATLVLCSTLGALDVDLRPFGPKGWETVCWRLSDVPDAASFLLTAHEDALLKRLPMGDVARIIALRRERNLAVALENLHARGISVWTWADTHFPAARKLPWPVVFAHGDPAILEPLPARGVAVAGARDAPEEALALARRLGVACAHNDLTVVSGGANGIDSAAQCAALGASGASVFLLPFGLDTREARSLTENLSGRALLLSAAHPSARFSPALAMTRNQALYAMASVAAVFGPKEGRGGTWTGARDALRRGKPPVMVFSGYGAGDSALIAAGGLSVLGEKGIAAIIARAQRQ